MRKTMATIGTGVLLASTLAFASPQRDTSAAKPSTESVARRADPQDPRDEALGKLEGIAVGVAASVAAAIAIARLYRPELRR